MTDMTTPSSREALAEFASKVFREIDSLTTKLEDAEKRIESLEAEVRRLSRLSWTVFPLEREGRS